VATRILVYGAGAVGSFFGGLLARAGHDVDFVARGAQLEALRTRGLRIDSRILGTIELPHVSAHARASETGTADLVLVCVKTHQTAGVLDDLATALHERTMLVPLQNGVEADEVLAARFGWARVVSAVVYVGATLEQPGVVSHAAAGTIVLGARPGFDATRLPPVHDALSAPGVRVERAKDIQRERWRKLVWNASFNTISALTQRTTSELMVMPEARALVETVMREVIAVAQAQGISLSGSEVTDQMGWTARAPAIRTSMMVDRGRRRPMEIDALTGVVVRKGREAGVPTPCTEALHALLTAVDERG
jgi:2-dehydropantoate 2-reductase